MFNFSMEKVGNAEYPVAITENQKYKALAYFLSTEANEYYAAAAWLRGIHQIQEGIATEWGGGGDVYVIEMTPKTVTIEWPIENGPPDRYGVYDFDEFVQIYHTWLDFLREHGRYP